MKITARGQYATRAMLQIALNEDQWPLSLHEISMSESISVQYLEQIFRDLRKAGLVEGIRGAHGGYLLKRKAEQISVGDIIRSVEGPIMPVGCLANGKVCKKTDQCVTRKVWAKLQQSMLEVLNQTTLLDMINLANE